METMVRRYDDGTPRTKHVTTNLMIDVDDGAGAATAKSYFTVLQQVDDLVLQVIIAGRYHDRFERVAGEWRFVDRLIYSDLIGDLTHHLTVDPFTLELGCRTRAGVRPGAAADARRGGVCGVG